MKNTLYAGFMLVLLLLPTYKLAHSAEAKPKLVTTLHPIGLIAAEIIGSSENITVLIQPGNTPHHYQLKPSHVKALNDADLVIWVGNSLEMFMRKPISQLSQKNTVITLDEISELTRLEYRANALWTDHNHDNHAHDHVSNIDGHLWLSASNAIIIAELIEQRLSSLNPERTTLFQTNLAVFIEKTRQLDQKIQKAMTPYKNTPFLVYHDAFHYFESRYALNSLGTFITEGSQSLSAKRLRSLNKLIETNRIKCIFSDQQYNSSLPKKVAAHTGAKVVTLDPIGSTINVENGGYRRLLETISKNMLSCFSE